MNVDVANESLDLLNRNIANMAESVIQSTTSTSKSVSDEERCGQFMSLWRPIMCRNQIYRSHDLSSAPQYLSAVVESKRSATPSNKMRSDSNNSIAVHANSKSIPVHCVVISTSTPCYLTDAPQVVDSKTEGRNSDHVDMDSYAIIPASTLFMNIVPTVMRKLGYSDETIFNATGWLIMKNWRPLSLSQIASSDRDTVGDILGELTTVATLKIFIRRNSNSIHLEIKNKVLRWLLGQSQHLISNTRFPLDEKWQQRVIRGERPSTPTPETRRQFETWFHHEMSQNSLVNRMDKSNNSPVHENSLDVSRDLGPHAFPPRIRMRTTFDPEQELPRLQRWFAENQHPTRFQLQLYVQELNSLDSRRGRKPLDVSNLVYWFKNARAAYKRAEVRNQSGSNPDTEWNAQSMNNEDSSDENPRADNEDDIADEDVSSISDRSNSAHSFENRAMKPDPDLREEPCEDPQPGDEDDPSDSEENDDNEYAENLSLSKNTEPQSESEKLADPPQSSASSSNADCHYRMNDYSGFPLALGHAQNVLNPHGLVYMTSPYLQGLGSSMLPAGHNRVLDPLSLANSDDRRKRNRTFIDPVTEVPRLEHWFSLNTHPSHSLVLRYTEELNRQPYRQKFPKLEPKNVQFWFKNRRAKCKRLKLSL